MKEKLYESLADLLNARSVITLMIFGTACLLTVLGKPIPPLLDIGCKALFGIWFGEKAWKYIKEGGAK